MLQIEPEHRAGTEGIRHLPIVSEHRAKLGGSDAAAVSSPAAGPSSSGASSGSSAAVPTPAHSDAAPRKLTRIDSLRSLKSSLSRSLSSSLGSLLGSSGRLSRALGASSGGDNHE